MNINYPTITAHKHCSNNRNELENSELCGCFYCCTIFKFSDIEEWIDEVDGILTTAICPYCGIDSVIGSASGYQIASDFLGAMKRQWF